VLTVPIQALTIVEVEVDKDGQVRRAGLEQEETSGTRVARADLRKTKRRKKELEGLFEVTRQDRNEFRTVKTGYYRRVEIEITANLKVGRGGGVRKFPGHSRTIK